MWKESVLQFEVINKRMYYISLKEMFYNMLIVSFLVSTEEKGYEEKDGFYKQLEQLYNTHCPDMI